MIIKSRDEKRAEVQVEQKSDINRAYEDFLISYFGKSIARLKAEVAALEALEDLES